MRKTVFCLVLLTAALPLAALDLACPAPWGYEAPTGPNQWGQMYEAWAKCDSGFTQSPIRIGTVITQALQLTLNYGSFPITVQNTGHEIKIWPLAATPDGAISVTYEGTTYRLEQFHFHVPAEHVIEGMNPAPVAEVHFVHKDAGGNALAVAVLIQRQAADNPGLVVPLRIAPTAACTSAKADIYDGASSLLPPNRNAFYYYEGSLTTPPCSQPVFFIVMRDPIRASDDQIRRLAIAHGPNGNARPTQPLGTRFIRKSF